MGKTLRTFVAFELPAHVIDRAAALQGALKTRGLKLRWVKPQNLHLTLKFLGDIPETHVPQVGETLGRVGENEPPLELAVQGMGVFPNIKRARVLWIGFGGQVDRLRQLHLKLEDELDKIGFDRDKRGFKAHLTIARIKGAVEPSLLLDAIAAVGDFGPESFEARRMVLYRSELHPKGAIYTPLAETHLR